MPDDRARGLAALVVLTRTGQDQEVDLKPFAGQPFRKRQHLPFGTTRPQRGNDVGEA
jgi:hypothetical protein